MRTVSWLIAFLVLAFALAGCGLSTPKMLPTQNEDLSTPTIITQMSTLLPTPIPTTTLTPFITREVNSSPTLTPAITSTPLDTLEPDDANEIIKTLLREPVDCSAPCFWGITPGQTTAGEAVNIITQLGLQTIIIAHEGKDFYNVDYDLDSGLSISINIPIQNGIVETIRLTLVPDLQKAGTEREWAAYSPETLIERYGVPSRVDFAADWGPGSFFEILMYFDTVDLIVEYAGQNIIPGKRGPTRVCPLSAPFDAVRLWIGEHPKDPPGEGIALEKATSLMLDEFSQLMTGDPNQACFIFDGNAIQ